MDLPLHLTKVWSDAEHVIACRLYSESEVTDSYVHAAARHTCTRAARQVMAARNGGKIYDIQ